jgi:hypothetical protein
MKHLKPYNLFENIEYDDEELLEIRDIFQQLADEWDIQWIDEIDWSEIEDDSFIYSIQRISSPNHPYKCLVHLILPANRDLPVWRNLDNFISDVEDIVARMKNMGYKRATHYQFVDAKRSNEDEQRHFQVRF